MCGGRSEESCAAIIVDAWKMLHDFPLTRRSKEHLYKSIEMVAALLSSGSGFPKQGNFFHGQTAKFYAPQPGGHGEALRNHRDVVRE